MKPNRLTTTESLALDIIRTLAAMVVAVGHLTQPYFSAGWPDLTWIAVDSVAVFFVLSGFVIRYVTCRQPATFQRYLGDRASRIYSVAIPALLLTLLTDTIAKQINPQFYANWALDYVHPIRRIVYNLLFCAHIWHFRRDPLSNSPFWSINYEVAYYVLYGCLFYLRAWKRWLSLIAVCLFVGPEILYLAPLWFAGCWAYDLYARWNASGVMFRRLVQLSAALALVSGAWFMVAAHIHLPSAILQFAEHARIKPYAYRFGVVWTLLFLWLLWLARQVNISREAPFIKPLQFIAEGTYPLYLIHFPLFVVIAACIPYNHAAILPKIAIFVSVVVLGVLAGHPANQLKQQLRAIRLPSFLMRKESSPV